MSKDRLKDRTKAMRRQIRKQASGHYYARKNRYERQPYERAIRVLGSEDAARKWMLTINSAIGGIPWVECSTVLGRQKVFAALSALEERRNSE